MLSVGLVRMHPHFPFSRSPPLSPPRSARGRRWRRCTNPSPYPRAPTCRSRTATCGGRSRGDEQEWRGLHATVLGETCRHCNLFAIAPSPPLLPNSLPLLVPLFQPKKLSTNTQSSLSIVIFQLSPPQYPALPSFNPPHSAQRAFTNIHNPFSPHSILVFQLLCQRPEVLAPRPPQHPHRACLRVHLQGSEPFKCRLQCRPLPHETAAVALSGLLGGYGGGWRACVRRVHDETDRSAQWRWPCMGV